MLHRMVHDPANKVGHVHGIVGLNRHVEFRVDGACGIPQVVPPGSMGVITRDCRRLKTTAQPKIFRTDTRLVAQSHTENR
jgi:hypothetical protein